MEPATVIELPSVRLDGEAEQEMMLLALSWGSSLDGGGSHRVQGAYPAAIASSGVENVTVFFCLIRCTYSQSGS